METIFSELRRIKLSRNRLFEHCINLMAVVALDLEKEKDPVKAKYKKDIYDLTFEAIKIDEKEMLSFKDVVIKNEKQ